LEVPDQPRLHELRRRVQADPASIAFAQLAEEYRRLGAYDEAVAICRVGLRRHPDYLSARVTLGRALVELGVLDEAERELQLVAAQAPDNLAAIRGLAEIYQRRGQMNEALTFYRRALTLARHDPDITEAVERISQVVEPPPPPPEPMTVQSVEELFDFDRLLEQLGERVAQVPQAPQVLQVEPAEPEEPGEPAEPAEPAQPAAPVDLRDLEAALREREVDRAAEERTRRRELMGRRRAAALHRLEAWLRAIEADRLRPNHA
jgi:tetratricopeptide (TPR) repeat protein